MANSVEIDQTAPSEAVRSRSALFAYAILLATLVYKILGHYCIAKNFKKNRKNLPNPRAAAKLCRNSRDIRQSANASPSNKQPGILGNSGIG